MKKRNLILLILLVLIAVVGCNTDSIETPPDIDVEDEQQMDDNDGIIDTEPDEVIEEIVLYYVNKEYVMTGNEDLDKIIPVKREVVINDEPIEKVIMAELQKAPEDEELDTSLDDLKILDVKITGEIVNVDISSEGLSGGSLQESMILNQTIYTFTELPEVEAVQFLVDGKKAESLMGHFTIEEPLKRE